MALVKITKIKTDENDAPLTTDKINDFGEKIGELYQKEDIVCEFIALGRVAQEGERGYFYQDVMYLRRCDDGTVETAEPGEVVFLDKLNDYEQEKKGNKH